MNYNSTQDTDPVSPNTLLVPALHKLLSRVIRAIRYTESPWVNFSPDSLFAPLKQVSRKQGSFLHFFVVYYTCISISKDIKPYRKSVSFWIVRAGESILPIESL